MDVAGRNAYRAVPSDAGKCRCVAPRFPQPSQKCVPQTVEHKRRHWYRVILGSLPGNRVERSSVLFPEAGWLGITRRTLIRHEQSQHRRRRVRLTLLLRLRELETKYPMASPILSFDVYCCLAAVSLPSLVAARG